MDQKKREIALQLILGQHHNLDTIGLEAAKKLPYPHDEWAEAMLYHFKSCFRALEIILEDDHEQSLN